MNLDKKLNIKEKEMNDLVKGIVIGIVVCALFFEVLFLIQVDKRISSIETLLANVKSSAMAIQNRKQMVKPRGNKLHNNKMKKGEKK